MENVHTFQNHEDIMDEAYAWVLKFNSDTPANSEDVAALREWAGRSPAHKKALQEAEAFWCEAEILSSLSVPLQKKKRSLLSGFAAAFSLAGGAVSTINGRSAVLASILFVGMALAGVLQFSTLFGSVGNGVYRTAVGEQATLTLSDHTQVLLDTGSEVRIAYEEGTRKIQLLSGKAHFEVAKDPERPFEVYARDGLVRAVGTAFSVYLGESNVEVLVDEGKVDLARILEQKTSANKVTNIPSEAARPMQLASQDVVGEVFLSLEVGQAASFDRAQQVLVELTQKELDDAQAWRNGTLVFVRDPLSDVVYEVSRYTNITIEITDPALRNLVMGGRFKAGDLDALLEVLEIGFGVKVIYLNERHVQLSLSSNE